MELIKLYRGNNDTVLALHKDSTGRYYSTASCKGQFKKPVARDCEVWMMLDRLEFLSLYKRGYQCEPVALLVSRYNGITRRFETADELYDYYSDPEYGHDLAESDVARVAQMLSRDIPVVFGKLTAYREKPWRYTDGVTAMRADYHSPDKTLI